MLSKNTRMWTNILFACRVDDWIDKSIEVCDNNGIKNDAGEGYEINFT